MINALNFINAILLCGLLSFNWAGLAYLSQQDATVFLPNGFRFAAAAATVLLLKFVFEQRLPKLTLKLVPSAVALSAVGYILPSLIFYYSLRQLPSSLVAIALAPVPVYLLFFWPTGIWGGKVRNVGYTLLGLCGLLVFYQAGRSQGPPTVLEGTFLFLLVFAAFLMALTVAMTRRLFWLHSTTDLNFWAFFFAFIFFLIVAWFANESYLDWNKTYWQILIGLGVAILGLGTYLYRLFSPKATFWPAFFMVIMTPLTTVAVGIWMAHDTPLNAYSLFGVALSILPFFLGKKNEHPHVWLVHFFTNTRREGDRVACSLDGFVKTQSQSTLKIKFTDLSLGGFGFFCEGPVALGEHVVVTLPIPGAGWNTMNVDCQVIHGHQNASGLLPFSGGMAFQKLSREARQALIEFLAKVSNPELA